MPNDPLLEELRQVQTKFFHQRQNLLRFEKPCWRFWSTLSRIARDGPNLPPAAHDRRRTRPYPKRYLFCRCSAWALRDPRRSATS
jgi:hypothetical protein